MESEKKDALSIKKKPKRSILNVIGVYGLFGVFLVGMLQAVVLFTAVRLGTLSFVEFFAIGLSFMLTLTSVVYLFAVRSRVLNSLAGVGNASPRRRRKK